VLCPTRLTEKVSTSTPSHPRCLWSSGFQDALASICVSAPRLDGVFPPFSERGGSGGGGEDSYALEEGYGASSPTANDSYGPPSEQGYPPAYRHLLEEGQLAVGR
jgi:hypothetical protein